MTTNPIGRVRITKDASGKTKIQRVHTYRPGASRKREEAKAAAKAKKWGK